MSQRPRAPPLRRLRPGADDRRVIGGWRVTGSPPGLWAQSATTPAARRGDPVSASSLRLAGWAVDQPRPHRIRWGQNLYEYVGRDLLNYSKLRHDHSRIQLCALFVRYLEYLS